MASSAPTASIATETVVALVGPQLTAMLSHDPEQTLLCWPWAWTRPDPTLPQQMAIPYSYEYCQHVQVANARIPSALWAWPPSHRRHLRAAIGRSAAASQAVKTVSQPDDWSVAMPVHDKAPRHCGATRLSSYAWTAGGRFPSQHGELAVFSPQ